MFLIGNAFWTAAVQRRSDTTSFQSAALFVARQIVSHRLCGPGQRRRSRWQLVTRRSALSPAPALYPTPSDDLTETRFIPVQLFMAVLDLVH